MMDFEFSEDTMMLRDILRRFIQKEAQPLEMKYFTAGSLTPEESSRLRRSIEQLGLWGVMAPEQYGGGGLDLVTGCVIHEELGQTFIPVDIGEVSPLLYACQGEQVTRYLQPALAGERRLILAAREPSSSRPEDWTTSAALIAGEPGQYLLNGSKAIASCPKEQDFFILFARLPADPPATGLTAFILDVDNPGLQVSMNGNARLTARDCLVGAQAVLGRPGEALALAADDAPGLWIQTGARYVGIVQRLLELSVAYARDSVLLGAPLAMRPAIQRIVAEMSAELESARWLVYHAAWLMDRQGVGPGRLAAMQARLVTGEMLNRAVESATMIFAGPGPSIPVEPLLMVRSVVPHDAVELSLEYARAAISSEVLGLYHLGGDS